MRKTDSSSPESPHAGRPPPSAPFQAPSRAAATSGRPGARVRARPRPQPVGVGGIWLAGAATATAAYALSSPTHRTAAADDTPAAELMAVSARHA